MILLGSVTTLFFMSVYVSHESACFYWRHASDHQRTLVNRCDELWSSSLPESQITPALALGGMFGTSPIHLLTPNALQRPQKTQFKYHVCSKLLEPGSFCRVSGSLFVASPELALAQMARSLPSFQFVDLCMEFMGTYALRSDMHRGFASRDNSLVVREKLLSTLRDLLGNRQCRQIELLLESAVSGSRSPMETREYLLLVLPKKYGGYGLPKPKMNAKLELTPAQQRETGRQYIECDLLWPESRIAVEYDGDVDHASYEARMRDATKRNVLQASGIRQFTFTARQVLDANAFDAVARNIAHAMGYRLRDFPGDWAARREFLRSGLFKSLGSHGNNVGQ